ncbi:MAG TPA: response regulator, partial [Spirochaetia bacterium]|nr:response regulator [Spirochaetia bacterium]
MKKGAGKMILLVEDEALISAATSRTLQRFGFTVRTAPTGERAVEAVDTDPGIDLVLMDIDLGPGIDGAEAARRILRIRDLPLVFHSAHTEPEVVEKLPGFKRRLEWFVRNRPEFREHLDTMEQPGGGVRRLLS